MGEALDISPDDVRDLPLLPGQTLEEDDRRRLASLGANGPRDVAGKVMTHCVPNERVAVADEARSVGAS